MTSRERSTVFSLDCGSTNFKGAVFDSDLMRLSEVSFPVTYTSSDDKIVELDPVSIREMIVQLAEQACYEAGTAREEIGTVSIAGQAQTFAVFDAAGNALTPFISWLDRRAEDQALDLQAELGGDFHDNCSFPVPSAQLQISKILWL